MEVISLGVKSASAAGLVQCHVSGIGQPNSFDSSSSHPSAPVCMGLASGTQYSIQPNRGETSEINMNDTIDIKLSFVDESTFIVPTHVCIIMDITEQC